MYGGLGTATPLPDAWVSGAYQSGCQSDITDISEDNPLPYPQEVPPVILSLSDRPIVKTNSLQEIKIMVNNIPFIDRVLPPAAKHISPHPRFTPTYFVALHNLVACSGRDANGQPLIDTFFRFEQKDR